MDHHVKLIALVSVRISVHLLLILHWLLMLDDTAEVLFLQHCLVVFVGFHNTHKLSVYCMLFYALEQTVHLVTA